MATHQLDDVCVVELRHHRALRKQHLPKCLHLGSKGGCGDGRGEGVHKVEAVTRLASLGNLGRHHAQVSGDAIHQSTTTFLDTHCRVKDSEQDHASRISIYIA